MNEQEESVVSVIGRLAVRLILMALAALVLFAAASYAYRFGKEIFYQAPMEAEPGTDVEVTVTEGMGSAEFAETLMKKGLIRNKDAFVIQTKLYQTELIPGTYVLNTSMSSKELLTAVGEQAQAILEETEAAEADEEISVMGGGDEEGTDHGEQ